MTGGTRRTIGREQPVSGRKTPVGWTIGGWTEVNGVHGCLESLRALRRDCTADLPRTVDNPKGKDTTWGRMRLASSRAGMDTGTCGQECTADLPRMVDNPEGDSATQGRMCLASSVDGMGFGNAWVHL